MSYIYCIYHKYFETDGKNVFKLGRTKCVTNRLKSVKTFALDDYQVIYRKKVKDNVKAEQLLFVLLREYRIKPNREFFQLPIQEIKKTMDQVADQINSEYTLSNDIQLTKKQLSTRINITCTSSIDIKQNITQVLNQINKACSLSSELITNPVNLEQDIPIDNNSLTSNIRTNSSVLDGSNTPIDNNSLMSNIRTNSLVLDGSNTSMSSRLSGLTNRDDPLVLLLSQPDLITQELISDNQKVDVDVITESDLENSSKKQLDVEELWRAPLLTNQQIAEFTASQLSGELKTTIQLTDELHTTIQLTNQLSLVDQLSLKKHWLITHFRLTSDQFNLDFLSDWYDRDHIIDNLLYLLGKNPIRYHSVEYIDQLRKRKVYLNQLLKVYGFDNLLDTKTVKKTKRWKTG